MIRLTRTIHKPNEDDTEEFGFSNNEVSICGAVSLASLEKEAENGENPND